MLYVCNWTRECAGDLIMQNRRFATTDGNLHEDRQSGRWKASMIDVSFREFTLANAVRADIRSAMDRRPCARARARFVSEIRGVRIKITKIKGKKKKGKKKHTHTHRHDHHTDRKSVV